MLLSTAIRKGITGRNQTTGQLMNSKGDVCALGSAGCGVKLWSSFEQYCKDYDHYDSLNEEFPILREHFQHPLCRDQWYSLSYIIETLNDTYKWSITKISQFVRKCEKGLVKKA